MKTVNATFRPAATTALERASMPSTCECCGREELKRTVKMISGDTVMWMGVGCAAKGTGVSVREINAALTAAKKEQAAVEKKANEAASWARQAAVHAQRDRAAEARRQEYIASRRA